MRITRSSANTSGTNEASLPTTRSTRLQQQQQQQYQEQQQQHYQQTASVHNQNETQTNDSGLNQNNLQNDNDINNNQAAAVTSPLPPDPLHATNQQQSKYNNNDDDEEDQIIRRPSAHQQPTYSQQQQQQQHSYVQESYDNNNNYYENSHTTASATTTTTGTRTRATRRQTQTDHYNDYDDYYTESDDYSTESSESEYEERGKKSKRTKKKKTTRASSRGQYQQQPQRTSSRLQNTTRTPNYIVDKDDDDDEEEQANYQYQETIPRTRRQQQQQSHYSSNNNTNTNTPDQYQYDQRPATRTTRHSQVSQQYDHVGDYNNSPNVDHYYNNNNSNNTNTYNNHNAYGDNYGNGHDDDDDDDDDDTESSALSSDSELDDVNSDEYDEYIELLRQKNKATLEPDSDDEQIIFKRINPAEFAAFPTVPPSTVNLLAEAVHGILTSTNKESTLRDLASKLADLDSDPLLSSSNTGQNQDGNDNNNTNTTLTNPNQQVKQLTQQDIQNQTILHGWGQVGGHKDHLKVLHEMIILPLLYPEIFHTFNISPPRGVLFTGPPGTGKTLTARTLATIVQNISGKKVSFFVRKGADCLSKWVGEAERQLRLLFDQAKAMQPSIIFFDELDGLAPVRNSNQDHIHSSIVSTLLALMDGLDGRGEQVIVIGATNRVDSIDPALRRPGRFDRELTFSLPTQQERLDILNIHTKSWSNCQRQQLDQILSSVSRITAGYSGADLQSLCTQASLCCLRRSLPHLYSPQTNNNTNHNINGDNKTTLVPFVTQMGSDPTQMSKLLENITVSYDDFITAMKSITPTQQRVFSKASQPLNQTMQLIYNNRQPIIQDIKQFFINNELIPLPSSSSSSSTLTLVTAAPTTSSTTTTITNDDDDAASLTNHINKQCSCCPLCKPLATDPTMLSSSLLPQQQYPNATLYDQLLNHIHTLLPVPHIKQNPALQPHISQPQSNHHTIYQNKLFLINRSNLGQQSLAQSLLTEYEEIPIYTLSLSSLHNLQLNYGTSTLYDTVLTLFTNIKRDHFQNSFNTKYPSCIIHWPTLHQWYEFSYLRELIDLILLSLAECSHLVSNITSIATSTAHQLNPLDMSNSTVSSFQQSSATNSPVHGFLLLCDAEWDYFSIPNEILSIFNHTSAQGVILDVSHNSFHNLLTYPHSSFPQDITKAVIQSDQVETSNDTDVTDIFSLFDPASQKLNSEQNKDVPVTSNCRCSCSRKTQSRLTTILTDVLRLFMRQYILDHQRFMSLYTNTTNVDDIDNNNNEIQPVKKKQTNRKNNTDKNTNPMVQLSSSESIPSTNNTTTTPDKNNNNITVVNPSTTSSTHDFITASINHEEDVVNPDKVYFSMREQRYREIILLHLRMFLRNVHAHLIAHFKDFVVARDDLPTSHNNGTTANNPFSSTSDLNQQLTLTIILTKINTTQYLSIREYLYDIDKLVAQIKHRFDLSTDLGRVIIQRVCAMQDVALTLCLGFDVQIATVCELIAKEIRLKQEYYFQKIMLNHYNNPTVNPAITINNIQLFGHIFQYESLLMVTDLRKHVQTYLTQRQSLYLLKLQQQKINSLNIVAIDSSTDANEDNKTDSKGTSNTSMDDVSNNNIGEAISTKPNIKKRPLVNVNTNNNPTNQSTQETTNVTFPTEINSTSVLTPLQPNMSINMPLLTQLHFLIEQLGVFTASIDVPTMESVHQQLLQCLSFIQYNKSMDSLDQLQPLFLSVLQRFLTFCRKNDEVNYDGFFTAQWLQLCLKQKQQEQGH